MGDLYGNETKWFINNVNNISGSYCYSACLFVCPAPSPGPNPLLSLKSGRHANKTANWDKDGRNYLYFRRGGFQNKQDFHISLLEESPALIPKQI